MAGRQGNFKPLQRSVPHDNRGFLWSAHVFHFMTVSSCTSATSTTGGPESKETKQGPKLGFYKHTHTCPRRRRRKEKFAKIGDTRAAAGLHLIFAAAGNHFCCLFRSVCLIPCFLFFRFGRTLGPAHALHQQSMSLLRPNWKNNLSVSGIILGFVFIFISSPNTKRQIISFDFFLLANGFLSTQVTRRRCLDFLSTIPSIASIDVIQSQLFFWGGLFTNIRP